MNLGIIFANSSKRCGFCRQANGQWLMAKKYFAIPKIISTFVPINPKWVSVNIY